MYNGNSRYNLIGDGLVSELISTRVILTYDPTTQATNAQFVGTPHLNVEGKYIPLGLREDFLLVSLTQHMTRLPVLGFNDPVTGADLSQVSIAGVQMLIKLWYDTFHNENYLATLPPTEPEPEPPAVLNITNPTLDGLTIPE